MVRHLGVDQHWTVFIWNHTVCDVQEEDKQLDIPPNFSLETGIEKETDLMKS
ncbi:hypothetical protein QY96_00271 [Bacillus thermotolerans]|nr:hypothetical protein QY96_00271 [Bacillus thermotolerans]